MDYIGSTVEILTNLAEKANISQGKGISDPSSDYEEMIQKLEEEARNHVGIEQQLKLCIDNLQEKIGDQETMIEELKNDIKNNTKECSKWKEKFKRCENMYKEYKEKCENYEMKYQILSKNYEECNKKYKEYEIRYKDTKEKCSEYEQRCNEFQQKIFELMNKSQSVIGDRTQLSTTTEKKQENSCKHKKGFSRKVKIQLTI